MHADLKPANVMWSNVDGAFKLLDFGLTFHTDETDLHQIQTKGYQAPEAAEWNSYKEDLKKKRRRKLQGTYCDLRLIPPAYHDRLHQISSNSSIGNGSGGSGRASPQRQLTPQSPISPKLTSESKDRWPSESSGVYTASEQSQCTSPPPSKSSSSSDKKNSTSDLSCSESSTVTPVHSVTNVIHSSSSSNSSPANSRRRYSVIYSPSPLVVTDSSLGGTSVAAAAESAVDWRRGRKHRSSSVSPTVVPNAAVDMWSFGCLLYEMLTGKEMCALVVISKKSNFEQQFCFRLKTLSRG